MLNILFATTFIVIYIGVDYGTSCYSTTHAPITYLNALFWASLEIYSVKFDRFWVIGFEQYKQWSRKGEHLWLGSL